MFAVLFSSAHPAVPFLNDLQFVPLLFLFPPISYLPWTFLAPIFSSLRLHSEYTVQMDLYLHPGLWPPFVFPGPPAAFEFLVLLSSTDSTARFKAPFASVFL